jgi:hypothetical protein
MPSPQIGFAEEQKDAQTERGFCVWPSEQVTGTDWQLVAPPQLPTAGHWMIDWLEMDTRFRASSRESVVFIGGLIVDTWVRFRMGACTVRGGGGFAGAVLLAFVAYPVESWTQRDGLQLAYVIHILNCIVYPTFCGIVLELIGYRVTVLSKLVPNVEAGEIDPNTRIFARRQARKRCGVI